MKKNEQTNTLEFIYQATEIHFLVNPTDKNVMINATEMSKMFDKRTKDYLANKETKTLIEELKRTLIGVQITDDRGRNGIYFCELLALDFAAWLDVKFKVWIYQTIRELITKDIHEVNEATKYYVEKEKSLQLIVAEVEAGHNAEAKKLLQMLEEFQDAKKYKTKAFSNFSKQYKMKF